MRVLALLTALAMTVGAEAALGQGGTAAPPSSPPVDVTPPETAVPPAGSRLMRRQPVPSSTIAPDKRDEELRRKSQAIDAKVRRGICQGC